MKIFGVAIIVSVIIILSFIIGSCKKNVGQAAAKDTWAVIQENILNLSCATNGCHASTSDVNYAQHNLVLSTDVAYDNLVNKVPKNTAANAAGLLRVKAGDYVNSLLYQKIDCRSASQYGALMPLGGPNLTVGQIEFIKQWIIKGAPKTGSVVDETVLDNKAVCEQPFVPIQAPDPGEGFQLSINSFTVSPNTEREVFVNRITPNTSTVYVNKIIVQGRQNSHHFVLYGFQNLASLPPANIVRDLYNADGSINASTFFQMQNHIYL
ncbi:MAG TPA: hypothetical protein VMY77_07775, partial [Chitinophagaceae bacterium]|nr:hypothetical protein [Chitinophagaceae bacterium]